jgi:hypothetical protein
LLPRFSFLLPPSAFQIKKPCQPFPVAGLFGFVYSLIRLQTTSGPATVAGKIKVKPIIGGLERSHVQFIGRK